MVPAKSALLDRNLIWKHPLGTATALPITDLPAKSGGHLGIGVVRGRETVIANHSRDVIYSPWSCSCSNTWVCSVLSPLSPWGTIRKCSMFPRIWAFVHLTYRCCPKTGLSGAKLQFLQHPTFKVSPRISVDFSSTTWTRWEGNASHPHSFPEQAPMNMHMALKSGSWEPPD